MTGEDLSVGEEDPIPPIGVQNAPERIWLVVGELLETSDFNDIRDVEGVQWCDSLQDEHDVEYVRADLVEALRKENERLKAEAAAGRPAAETVAIPIYAAGRLAEEYGYDQVVIVARKVGVREHVTTYGVDKAHCAVAARMGNFFKHKLMGWPAEPAADRSAQVAEVMRLVVEACSASAAEEWGFDDREATAKAALLDAVEAAVRNLAGEA